MNFKQLALDLKKQGFRCEFSKDGNDLLVYYLCFSDYAVICLSPSHDWSVAYYQAFKDVEIYNAPTNWSLIKLLNKLMVEV
nr:MAG TPA: hypothetical protein [Caudoviricetes sp.]